MLVLTDAVFQIYREGFEGRSGCKLEDCTACRVEGVLCVTLVRVDCDRRSILSPSPSRYESAVYGDTANSHL